MKRHRIALISGDGIGPEVTAAARQVIEATGAPIDWVQVVAGEKAYRNEGTPVPESAMAAIRGCASALKGPMTNPSLPGHASPNISLRIALGLYGNVRLAAALPGARTKFPGTDIMLVRDVTEDLYIGPQRQDGPDAASGTKIVTRAAVERVARLAFDWARRNRRRKVTIVHKATVLKLTDGLFLQAARAVAAGYPDIECDDILVDAIAMHLVREPEHFDVLLTGFQYGDILSDLCAGLAGGLGVVPGALVGEAITLFEPAHGTAPKYAGRDKANPTAMILCGALMLTHLGEDAAARDMWEAVRRVMREGTRVTADQGGSGGTAAMADAVSEEVVRMRRMPVTP
jgi:isocitrate dehydrogenase (NAD+)